jgi:hypothetical protein
MSDSVLKGMRKIGPTRRMVKKFKETCKTRSVLVPGVQPQDGSDSLGQETSY